jgi:hypothetical protein
MSFGKRPSGGIMTSNDEERGPFGISTLLAMLANLIVVIQFAGKYVAVAIVVVLAGWGVGLTYGRKILSWLLRYRRDLVFLLLGGVLAPAGFVRVLQGQPGKSAPCPPPPETTPCPVISTPAPEPLTSPIPRPDVVYRTPSGKKYHRVDCSYVRGKAIPVSLEEARKLGLTPCKVCHPPPLP